MKHQIAVMSFADETNHRQIRFETYPAHLLGEAEVAFLTVELADFKVESGVMHGDVIHTIEDLHLGDEFRITDHRLGLAANSGQSCRSPTGHSDRNAHLVSELEGCTQKHQLQLMDANGSLVLAYIISPVKESGLRPYLLMPRQFNPLSQYCMIAITLLADDASAGTLC
jgi:hypothetical protein